MSNNYPYLARSTIRYKSPHPTDLSFAKDETIRVVGPSPDDEDWLLGESLDGSRAGGFPKVIEGEIGREIELISCLYQDFVVKVEDEPAQPSAFTEEPSGAKGIAQPPPIVPPSSDVPGSTPLTHQPAETTIPARGQDAVEPHQEEDLANKTERLSLDQDSGPAPPAASTAEPIAAAPPRAVHPPPSSQALTSNPAPVQSMQATDSPEKPQSFKDKLAAFNRSATSGAGPPPLKPKPLGASGGVGSWAWKQKQQQAATEGTANAVPSDGATAEHHPAPTPVRETEDFSQHPPPAAASGMSASDAKASIAAGGSLRERMAALAGAGAFGSDKPKGPPPPVASKPRVWKRPEQPVVAEPTMGADEENAGQTVPPVALPHPIAVTFESAGHASEPQDGPREAEEQAAQAEDEDEEQKEKERRAAIAARMARLGGRGVMGMPMAMGASMGGAKPVTRQTETEHAAEGDVHSRSTVDVESKNVGEESSTVTPSLGEKPTASSEASTAPDPFTVPAASIAMPALPRKAGPPRRKPPTRTDTGGSGISAAASPSGTQQGGSAPPFPDAHPEPSPTVASAIEPPVQQEAISSPTTEGDDREIPLPKSEEELAKEREYEEAGRGPRGAEGAERAGIALANVGATEPSADARHEEPLAHHEGLLHHERSLPPPPPAADDDDDFGEPEGEEDENANDDIMKQAASKGLLSKHPNASDAQPTMDTAQPVDYQPLRSPAPSTGELPETPSVPQTVFSPPSAPQNLLGLPRDEVEMKKEAESAGDTDDDAPPPPPPRNVGDVMDEGERIKPAGPRPLPPSPARVLPPVQTHTPVSARPTEQHETPGSEGLERIAAGAPLPTRQASMRSSSQAGLSQSMSGEETMHSPVQRPRVQVTQETEQATTSPEDADAVRRQGIAARMAKLGGIKLGGPPIGGFQGHATSPGASPLSPTFTSRSEALASPTSPFAPPLQASEEAANNEEETEEQAAKRRQATLARLRAGGALGFGMFNNSTPTEESPVEASPVEKSTQPIPPPVESTSGEVDDAVPDDEQTDSWNVAQDQAMEQQHSREMPPVPPLGGDNDDDEPAPPPPPRRSLSIKSPVTSPIMPVAATMPSMHAPSRSVPPPAEDDANDMSEHGLAPPLPAIPSGQYVHEPESMEETREATDGMGPPPPVRTRDDSSHSRSSMDRSDSRASRVSMSSMSSDRGVPPASPVATVRRSNSGVRPGYNELREATKTYGAKVARAASKLIESSKKHAIGDGGPRALVWTAMAEAGLDPNVNFGTLIWEQQGPTIQQRLDDIHVGDIVVLHDVKLKGKKGLIGYTQQAGSVQEPVFGVCSHVEDKKTKIKVYQYERGHGDDVTYRLDDLRSGLVRIFRPMP